jgi:hypothetical protein
MMTIDSSIPPHRPTTAWRASQMPSTVLRITEETLNGK